jgi:hypothetical protein
MILQGKEERQRSCTCMVGTKCRRRGCHVLGGPSRLGYHRWIRGETVCDDCDAVDAEDDVDHTSGPAARL